MIREGYTKQYSDVFSKILPLYREWNLQALITSKRPYSLVSKF